MIYNLYFPKMVKGFNGYADKRSVVAVKKALASEKDFGFS